MLNFMCTFISLAVILIITVQEPPKIYQPIVYVYSTYDEAFYNLHRAFGVNKILILMSESCKQCQDYQDKILAAITSKHMEKQIYVYQAKVNPQIKTLFRYYDANGALLNQYQVKDQSNFDIEPLLQKINENKIYVVQKSNANYKIQFSKIEEQMQTNIDSKINQLRSEKKEKNQLNELKNDQMRIQKNKLIQKQSPNKPLKGDETKRQDHNKETVDKAKDQAAKQGQKIAQVQNKLQIKQEQKNQKQNQLKNIEKQHLNEQLNKLKQKEKEQLNNIQQKQKQISGIAEKSKQMLNQLAKQKAEFEGERHNLKEQEQKDKKRMQEVFQQLKQKIQRAQQNSAGQDKNQKTIQLNNFKLLIIGCVLLFIFYFLYCRQKRQEQNFLGIPSAQTFQADQLRI